MHFPQTDIAGNKPVLRFLPFEPLFVSAYGYQASSRGFVFAILLVGAD
jgi:hypothetical protein